MVGCGPPPLDPAIDVSEWPPLRRGHFTPHRGETLYLYRKHSGPRGRSGRVCEVSPPPAFDPRTVRPVSTVYTYCALTVHAPSTYRRQLR